MEEYSLYNFQVQYQFSYNLGFNSYIQTKQDEVVCNSSDEKKVFFIDIKKGKFIKIIDDIKVYIEDVDSFCFVNEEVIAMGGI